MAERNRSVLFIVRGDETVPSCRFRAFQYLEPLRRRGIKADCFILEKSKNPFRQALFHLKMIPLLRRYRVIVFQKLLEPRRLDFIRLFNRRLYYDFDDAMYLSADGARFPATIKAAPQVIAGNSLLAEKARAYNPSVTVIPTVVPIPDLLPGASVDSHAADAQPGDKGAFVLSWIGTATANLPYLNPLVDALDAQTDLTAGLQLRILTDKPELAPQRPWIRTLKWTRALEEREFRACDVGLMPLPDTEWCAGKCACKALQYLSYGKPIITSPVGVNRDLFAETAFAILAARPEEWLQAIARYREDAGLRSEAGESGRAFVRENFSLEAWAGKLAAHLGID